MRRFLVTMMCSVAFCAGISNISAYASSSFDAGYYAENNPDVVAVYGTDEAPLIRHYLNSGMAEGRKPSEQGEPGDSLDLTEEQMQMAWTPVPIANLANYKSIKKRMTDSEFESAYQEALKIVTPVAFASKEEQLIHIASSLRQMFDTQMTYSMSADHYNDPYGYLVLHSASCAGCVRATGLCLNILAIPYEHVNENQYSHQWCRVEVNGTYWICDAFGLYCGPEPAPRQHPYM